MLDIHLHEVEEHDTSYVITIHHPANDQMEELSGNHFYLLVKNLMEGCGLELSDVTIYYYYKTHNKVNELNEWEFDIYNGKYLGYRIVPKPSKIFSEDVIDIHLNMINSIYKQGYMAM